MKKIILFLTLIPLFTFGQDSYELNVYDEFTVSISGDVYYSSEKDDDGGLVYEELYNDDFELVVTVYEKGSYDYFSDLTLFIDEMAEGFGYKKHSEYYQRNYSRGLSGVFHITYDKQNDGNVIFGVIQDTSSKKLYEIELLCLNLGSKTAREIIKSIEIFR
tara:strand:+ start:501 stop:983 length:483 start_codon:yes stop_codon:yes gene_type:complete